jgi:colanic acid/amylovoran biosynthesis glycosyltransferase
MALIASEVSGIPWSFTARRWDILEDNLLSLKMVHASFARIISQSGLETIKELGIEVPDDRIPILHVGVHLPTRFQAPKDQQEEVNVPIILCPAGLRPIKGHKYLIEAFAILRGRSVESKLWLAGQGELRQELQEQVETLGLLDKVAFLGQLPHIKLLDLYSQGKIAMVVLPSLHEGIPVSLIEAMAYGVPVISTVAGGTPELLERGAGLLVPPEDPLALADAIERLVRDPELRKQLGETGRRRGELCRPPLGGRNLPLQGHRPGHPCDTLGVSAAQHVGGLDHLPHRTLPVTGEGGNRPRGHGHQRLLAAVSFHGQRGQ